VDVWGRFDLTGKLPLVMVIDEGMSVAGNIAVDKEK
jgi:hypothetical protein